MALNALEETEECPICMEKLQVHKSMRFVHLVRSSRLCPIKPDPYVAYSLTCEHALCQGCFFQLQRLNVQVDDDQLEERVSCPVCRQTVKCREVEVVRHTAATQWDALLNIANRWSRMDTGAGYDDEDSVESENDDNVNEAQNEGVKKGEDADTELGDTKGDRYVLSSLIVVGGIHAKQYDSSSGTYTLAALICLSNHLTV